MDVNIKVWLGKALNAKERSLAVMPTGILLYVCPCNGSF